MRIDCPHCGARDQGEFTYLGDAAPQRPKDGGTADAFYDYVYLRDNPAGEFDEHWYHAGGCRAWLRVTRDVRTHVISKVLASASRGSAR
jgi:sarcosine oxidase subunit delta